jgi:D-alanyl-D-alanine dipeptidase
MRLSHLFSVFAIAACASRAPRAKQAVSASTSPPVAPAAANAPADIRMGTSSEADTMLADVRRADGTIAVEMRYATPQNFTGAVLPGYEANRAFLRREAAAALGRVQHRLEGEGLSLKVWDAYRPVRATLAMVAWTQRTHRESLIRDGYIADRSRHNLGLAIDLTLIERASERELAMGTEFDTFSPAAHTMNARGTVLANRLRLKAAMEAEGFQNYSQEWWHYSYTVLVPLRFDVPVR